MLGISPNKGDIVDTIRVNRSKIGSLRHTRVGLALLALSISTLAASANEGAIEINQVCASLGGCFSGDLGGFPVTITNAGSYRLTSDLSLSTADTTGIRITGDDVSIDLAGFTIQGPGTVGTGRGIEHFTGSRVRIRNGSIVGTGSTGISLRVVATVTNMFVSDTGGSCISTSNAGMIRNSRVLRCGNSGIVPGGSPGLVLDSTVIDAVSIGIEAFVSVGVHRNVVRGSGLEALDGSFNNAYSNNILVENNGGSSNPQVTTSGMVNLEGNLCGTGPAACP
ncbi:MAG: hypothetical protein HKN13_13965 [Rhodothermales bacterium]|nr:hypothetical protein [Rhodothermales bacterium]